MNNLIPGVPEELPKYISSPRSARAWMYDQLCQEGYRIVIDPVAEDLPEELADFSIDLAAFRGTDLYIVLIRRRNDISDNNLALIELLEKKKNWHYCMIVLPVKMQKAA